MNNLIKNESDPNKLQELYNILYYMPYYFEYKDAYNYDSLYNAMTEYRNYYDKTNLPQTFNAILAPTNATKTQVDEIINNVLETEKLNTIKEELKRIKYNYITKAKGVGLTHAFGFRL